MSDPNCTLKIWKCHILYSLLHQVKWNSFTWIFKTKLKLKQLFCFCLWETKHCSFVQNHSDIFLFSKGCNPKLKNLDGQLPSQTAKNSGHNDALGRTCYPYSQCHPSWLAEKWTVSALTTWLRCISLSPIPHEMVLKTSFFTKEKKKQYQHHLFQPLQNRT